MMVFRWRLRWPFQIKICPLSVFSVGVVVNFFTFSSFLFKEEMTKEERKWGGSYKIFWWNTRLISNKLSTSILGGRAFKFVQMKDHLIFKGKIRVLNCWKSEDMVRKFKNFIFQNQKACKILTLTLAFLIYCRFLKN